MGRVITVREWFRLQRAAAWERNFLPMPDLHIATGNINAPFAEVEWNWLTRLWEQKPQTQYWSFRYPTRHLSGITE